MHKRDWMLALSTAALLALAGCAKREPEQAVTAAPSAQPAAEPSAPAPSASVAAAPEDARKCTNEPRTDENDKRPRCGGTGTATPVPSHAYRITLDNGESITACDITKPFSGKIGGGMVTMSFIPSDEHGGSVAWHFAGGGGVADTAYDYALSGPAEKMTGSFHAKAAVCGKAAGLSACAAAKNQDFSSTWTRIEACGAAP